MRAIQHIQRTLVLCLCLVGIFGACIAADAYGSGKDVLLDCTDNGRLDKKYSQKEYAQALNQIQADAAQYENCEGLIRQAQIEKSSGQGQHHQGQNSQGNNSFGRKTPQGATAQELAKNLPPAVRQKVQQLKQASAPPPPAEVAGQQVTPSLKAKSPKLGKLGELPTPAIGLLGLLGFGFIGRGANILVQFLARLRR